MQKMFVRLLSEAIFRFSFNSKQQNAKYRHQIFGLMTVLIMLTK